MILNVIRESEYTNNNTNTAKKLNIVDEQKEKEIEKQVQLKKIKELIVEKDLRYVSENVRILLGLTKENDLNCFTKDPNVKRKVVEAGGKFRVILYIRLSQEDGDLKEDDVSGSIKNQLLYLLDECKKRGWLVVGIFCEEDISGVDDKRPEWLKSIRFAEVGNTEIVLCKSQSRFTRSMEMVEKYLHTCFPKWNVRFLGLVDNADTDIQENKKSRQINGLVNEWFVEDTSKNTRATLNSMKRNGQFTGSYAPYGYFIDPKDKHHLISDSHAREAIKIMAGMFKNGKSMKQISEVLMRKGFLTPADYKTSLGIKVNRQNLIKNIQYKVEKDETLKSIAYKFYVTVSEIKELNHLSGNIKEGDILIIPHKQMWTGSMIRKILTDETQIGSLVQGKTERTSYKDKKKIKKSKEDWIIVPHCHEANLDLETFNIVNSKIQPTSRNRCQKNGELPLFSKKVYCSCCGCSLSKNSSKGIEYLQCRNTKYGEHICDNGNTIKISELEEFVLENIKNKISKYFDLSQVSNEYYLQNIYLNIDKNIENKEKEKQDILGKLNQNKSLCVNLYKDLSNNIISLDEYNIIKSSNSLEREEIEQKLNNIEQELNGLITDREKQKNKVEIFEKYKNITNLNRVVLDAFISKIKIGKYNEETDKRPIEIEWNIVAN